MSIILDLCLDSLSITQQHAVQHAKHLSLACSDTLSLIDHALKVMLLLLLLCCAVGGVPGEAG
jgi:hypothetical protein